MPEYMLPPPWKEHGGKKKCNLQKVYNKWDSIPIGTNKNGCVVILRFRKDTT